MTGRRFDVAWPSAYLFFVLIILWSFLPDEWIVQGGVAWEWASLVPVLLTYFTYSTDSKGRLLGPATFDFADEGATTEVHNIPIALVNHALYDRGW